MRRLGVIGHPIGHSISPVFQGAALGARNLDAEYTPYDIAPEDLEDFLSLVRAPEWLGINVTIPHKQAVVPLVDELSEEAREIGAVNTIVNRSGALVGYNTDARGFLRALDGIGFDPVGRDAVVLGTGGAARAIVYALTRSRAGRVVVAGRRADRAAALVVDMAHLSGGTELRAVGWGSDELEEEVRRASLLVNATPIGMRGGGAEGESPVNASWLQPRLTVFDTVYNPPETPLLGEAARVEARAVSGLEMLVCQGAESFELWTGLDAPIEVMRLAAREALEG